MPRIEDYVGDPVFRYEAGPDPCMICSALDGVEGERGELEDYRDAACLGDGCSPSLKEVNSGAG